MPTELTTTYLAEIINITAFMLLIEREDYEANASPIRQNIRVLLWIIYISLLGCFAFHLIDIPFGWYILARIYSMIFIFLNLTICYTLLVTMKSTQTSYLYILLLLSLISSIIDWSTDNKYAFIYLINVFVSIYSLRLIRNFKIKVYDQSDSFQSWKRSKSFSLDAVQRIESFALLLNISIFIIPAFSEYHLFVVKASVHIIYFLKMYLIILSWGEISSSNNKKSSNQLSIEQSEPFLSQNES